MIDELKDATSTNFADRRSTTTPTADNAYQTADRWALLETAAADEDVPIELFSSTFNCATWVAHGPQ